MGPRCTHRWLWRDGVAINAAAKARTLGEDTGPTWRTPELPHAPAARAGRRHSGRGSHGANVGPWRAPGAPHPILGAVTRETARRAPRGLPGRRSRCSRVLGA